jgi:hypothetical protein
LIHFEKKMKKNLIKNEMKKKTNTQNKNTSQKNIKLDIKPTLNKNIIDDPFQVFHSMTKITKDDFDTGEEEKKKKVESDDDDIELDDENHDYKTSKKIFYFR